MIECSRCKTENPDENKYCGSCGAPTDPDLAPLIQYVDTTFRQQVESIAKEQLKDQKIELEATQLVAERLVRWARIGLFFAGIPFLLVVGIAGFLGIEKISDVSDQFDTKISKISEKFDTAGKQLDEDMKQAATKVAKITDQSNDLDKSLAAIEAKLDDIDKVTVELKARESQSVELARIIEINLEQDVQDLQSKLSAEVESLVEVKVAEEIATLEEKVTDIQESVCFTAFFDDVEEERWSPVEVGASDFDIIKPPQPIQGLIGIKFTDFDRSIGAIKIFPVPANGVFRVVSVVDSTCQEIEDYKNVSRGGPKDTLLSFDTLEMRIGGNRYQLRLGMEEEIEVNTFIKVAE